jgi:hypothetical protein
MFITARPPSIQISLDSFARYFQPRRAAKYNSRHRRAMGLPGSTDGE